MCMDITLSAALADAQTCLVIHSLVRFPFLEECDEQFAKSFPVCNGNELKSDTQNN